MRGYEEVDDEPPQPATEGPSYLPERFPPVPNRIKTSGRLALRPLEKFLMEKKKEKTSVKTEACVLNGRSVAKSRPSKDWRAGVRAISRFEKIIK